MLQDFIEIIQNDVVECSSLVLVSYLYLPDFLRESNEDVVNNNDAEGDQIQVQEFSWLKEDYHEEAEDKFDLQDSSDSETIK